MSVSVRVMSLLIIFSCLHGSAVALTTPPVCTPVDGEWVREGDKKRLLLGQQECKVLGSLNTDNFSYGITGEWNPRRKYYDIKISVTKGDKGCTANLKGRLQIIRARGKIIGIRTTIDQVVENSCKVDLDLTPITAWTKP
jgi:hypothetical protein